MLTIERFVSGRWRTNCYVVADLLLNALIVDPGSDTSAVLQFVRDKNLQVKAVLLTHGHYDHVVGVVSVVQALNVPVYMHAADKSLVSRMNLFRAIFDKDRPVEPPKIDFDLSTTTRLEFDSLTVDVIPTPGHTPGGVCFRFGEQMITGDTLLDGTVGRIDLPGANEAQLKTSLATLFALPADLLVNPGHGKAFRLGDFPKERLSLFSGSGVPTPNEVSYENAD